MVFWLGNKMKKIMKIQHIMTIGLSSISLSMSAYSQANGPVAYHAWEKVSFKNSITQLVNSVQESTGNSFPSGAPYFIPASGSFTWDRNGASGPHPDFPSGFSQTGAVHIEWSGLDTINEVAQITGSGNVFLRVKPGKVGTFKLTYSTPILFKAAMYGKGLFDGQSILCETNCTSGLRLPRMRGKGSDEIPAGGDQQMYITPEGLWHTALYSEPTYNHSKAVVHGTDNPSTSAQGDLVLFETASDGTEIYFKLINNHPTKSLNTALVFHTRRAKLSSLNTSYGYEVYSPNPNYNGPLD